MVGDGRPKIHEDMDKSMESSLVLAGGGHCHALILRRWAMKPKERPVGSIFLVSNTSLLYYSGMIPGYIAGAYALEDVAIDLRLLAEKAKVSFILGEITRIESKEKNIIIQGRPPLRFDVLSLNVGCVSRKRFPEDQNLLSVKPYHELLKFLDLQLKTDNQGPINVIGSGLAAIETAFAIQQRHKDRDIMLFGKKNKLTSYFSAELKKRNISVILSNEQYYSEKYFGVGGILCTGFQAADCIRKSSLRLNEQGRVITNQYLQLLDHEYIFGGGDCAVVDDMPRAAAGVWAVRSAEILGKNLSSYMNNKPLQRWRPQRNILQLVGASMLDKKRTAYALWGPFVLGPSTLLWNFKQRIDSAFMQQFKQEKMSRSDNGDENMLCFGCAAKLAAKPLIEALKRADLVELGTRPEDATVLPNCKFEANSSVLQSVDGFPALISDPWLNGVITTLHACSDIWACGGSVLHAQSVVTLPIASPRIQSELLTQTLAGIKNTLDTLGAKLIGGHTLESRDEASIPLSKSMQLVVAVNGKYDNNLWEKSGMKHGDCLLLSRALGTGVIFAASAQGLVSAKTIDHVLMIMSNSQHKLVTQLRNLEIKLMEHVHAATDITGFGLLGHLDEMLKGSCIRGKQLQIVLDSESIPALPDALTLLENGIESSLAHANKEFYNLLEIDARGIDHTKVVLNYKSPIDASEKLEAMKRLLIDPQTCGPLLISVSEKFANKLMQERNSQWHLIGYVKSINEEDPSVQES